MERQLKERLVGAAVLMAAAIILIPEMLSGPKRESRAPQTVRTSSDGSLKTYTIDLNRPPGSTSSPTASESLDERAPPPETDSPASNVGTETAPDTESPATAAPTSPGTQALPESAESGVAQNAPLAREQPNEAAPRMPQSASTLTETRPSRSDAPSRESNVSKPIASPPVAPTSRGWAVQVGSFASRATADRLVKDLAQQGQNAFVMPVKSGNSTLYRVRVGPFANRAAANDTLGEVKGRIANAAVVAHP